MLKQIYNSKTNNISIDFFLIIVFLTSMYFDISDSGKYNHRIFMILIMLCIYILRHSKIYFEKIMYIYVLFIILICASGIYGINNETAMGNIITLIACMILMVIIYNNLLTEKQLIIIINTIIAFSLILSFRVISVIDFDRLINGIYYPDVVLNEAIGNRNSIAILMAIGVNLSIYNIYVYKKFKNIIPFIIVLLAVFLTGSRKGLVLSILPFILFFLFKFIESKKIVSKIKYIIIGIILISSLFYITMNVEFIYDTVGFRLESIYREIVYGEASNEGSFNIRKDMVNKGLKYFSKKPILGYGVSNYRYLYGHDTGNETYSHNNYIELLVNNGIIGFLLYYSFYLSVIININRKRIKTKSIKESNYYLFMTCILISMFIMETGLVTYNSYLIYLLLGLGMKKLEKE